MRNTCLNTPVTDHSCSTVSCFPVCRMKEADVEIVTDVGSRNALADLLVTVFMVDSMHDEK